MDMDYMDRWKSTSHRRYTDDYVLFQPVNKSSVNFLYGYCAALSGALSLDCCASRQYFIY